jgi:hypothetical protein
MEKVLTGVHIISEEEAKEMIERNSSSIVFECFDKEELLAGLSNPLIKKVRIYYGRNEAEEPRLVVVGVDNEGKWIDSPMEKGLICPPICD